jgi:hypothetical protein
MEGVGPALMQGIGSAPEVGGFIPELVQMIFGRDGE